MDLRICEVDLGGFLRQSPARSGRSSVRVASSSLMISSASVMHCTIGELVPPTA